MRNTLRYLPLLALIGAFSVKLGMGRPSGTAEAAAPDLNMCGCYSDSAGNCYCGKKPKCGCPGMCEPKGCEEKRAKELDKEMAAEAKRAREAEKKQQDELAEKKRKEEKEQAPPADEENASDDSSASTAAPAKDARTSSDDDDEDEDDRADKRSKSKKKGKSSIKGGKPVASKN